VTNAGAPAFVTLKKENDVLKRFALAALMALGFAAAIAATSPHADAGLFGGKPAASPTPSASPSPLPTASPEPPSVAIPRLQAKLKANPNDQQALVELAGQFLGINRPDLAVQVTQHLLQLGNKTAQVYYLDGYSQQQLGNIPAAVADLEQASNLDPTNLGVLGELSTLYLRTNRPTDAERIANRAVTFNPKEPQAYSALGAVYGAEQKWDQARAEFEKAYALDPKDPQPLYEITQTWAQQNNIPMALQAVDRAIAVSPKDVDLLTLKADLYARQHDDAHASSAYDDAFVAATTDDEKVAILVRKAAYFSGEKKPDQATAVFQQLLAQFPKNAQAHVAYGDYFASQKNITSAQQQWQLALGLDPSNGPALLSLGQVALGQNKITDAIGYLKRLTAAAPDAQGFALLGQAYFASHDYTGQRDACSKSFQIQRSPQTLGCIAGADFELKNYKEASQIFDVLDKAAPQFLTEQPEYLFMAGKAYQQTNQRDKALHAYRRVLPLMKRGSPLYKQVVTAIAQLSKPVPAKKKKG